MTQYDKDYLKTLSVFNLTAQDQLSYAFDRLSELLTNANNPSDGEEPTIKVRSTVPGVNLRITLLDHANDAKASFQGDCRKKRLLITLTKSAQSPQGSNTASFGLLPYASLLDAGGAAIAEEPTYPEEDALKIPSKSEEESTAFYATG